MEIFTTRRVWSVVQLAISIPENTTYLTLTQFFVLKNDADVNLMRCLPKMEIIYLKVSISRTPMIKIINYLSDRYRNRGLIPTGLPSVVVAKWIDLVGLRLKSLHILLYASSYLIQK